ncbi:hypothetical protein A2773_04975 [Candidatus Gottesmanbacteria bacterium RIFCSPHIGHO2_01_FULL_39_10]|uniref:NlpC/P60 domain-containing protein n=1 Tax=Candidatus Gottesmanbacteria bacterium RIFCSPHIGHO2_01_FULL_39_10 TaxID=1798375 RepID=A0A1F5ZRX9_9BACT|nr:MAG: hypothetical protein A2773_04975 [Candidatus Gottesmanbacteria bacterium RIFCSPHIGHO2_01_FULL_39_10]
MIKDKKALSASLNKYISSYLEMDLGLIKVPCPYWMNKLKEGSVIIRGQFNGKGESEDIKNAFKKVILEANMDTKITQENVFKIAKRERIGIDCSGLVYRIVDHALRQTDGSLDQVFPGGINRTNTRMLTDKKFNQEILSAKDINPLDTIRLMGGKHILLVTDNNGKYITYIHSSNKTTELKGVHLGKIGILTPEDNLDKQNWLEKTAHGENFGKKYFNPKVGDGTKKLKILQ